MPAKQLLAKVHIAANQLGLEEDTYRMALENLTGKRSAKDLSNRQIIQVINHFKEGGWQEKTKPKKYEDLGRRDDSAPTPAMLRKLDALFHDICYSENQDLALFRFLFKRFKISHPRFLERKTCNAAIEAVKKIRERQLGKE
jgi:hypothetical protein